MRISINCVPGSAGWFSTSREAAEIVGGNGYDVLVGRRVGIYTFLPAFFSCSKLGSCKCLLYVGVGQTDSENGGAACCRKQMPSLGFLNRFAATVLGAIILYELEHDMVMEAFAAEIMGGCFLMTFNFGYFSMQEAKGETK